MAKPFPTDEPFLRGFYAPLHMECDAPNLPISGELPRELNGWLYRNGPNPQFAPRGPYHWFSGDGMLHAFHVADGRVSYRNRWVRTPKWQLEHDEGEGLSGAFGNPRFSDPRIVRLGSTIANTHVVWHGGRLLALEEAHAPFEVDPVTLEPKGTWTFDGQLVGPMTAHPKVDPGSGEMVFFGYAAKGRFTPDVALHTVASDGTLTRSQWMQAPYASMVHDFVVTQNWIVLPIFPLTGSMERALKGLPPYAWEPDKGSHVALIPRSGSVDDAIWFDGDPSYVFHPMNAFETADGQVVCDMAKYPVAPLFPAPAAAGRSSGRVPAARRALRDPALPPRLVPGRRAGEQRARPRRARRPRAHRPRERRGRDLDAGTRRPLRRAGVRAAGTRCGRRRRLRAQRDLPRGDAMQRPGRLRRIAPGRRPGRLCPPVAPRAGRLPRQLARRRRLKLVRRPGGLGTLVQCSTLIGT